MKNWEKNKKVYSKPELEVVKVDHEISLVMMSPDQGGGGPGTFGATTFGGSTIIQENTLKSSPFNNSLESSPSVFDDTGVGSTTIGY